MNDVGSVPWLALVLFAPWFLILAGLYWWYPRQPRHAARRRFDSIALVIAFAGCLASLFWSFGWADRSHGPLWPQILATSIGYGAFLGLLGVAWWLRARVILARR